MIVIMAFLEASSGTLIIGIILIFILIMAVFGLRGPFRKFLNPDPELSDDFSYY